MKAAKQLWKAARQHEYRFQTLWRKATKHHALPPATPPKPKSWGDVCTQQLASGPGLSLARGSCLLWRQHLPCASENTAVKTHKNTRPPRPGASCRRKAAGGVRGAMGVPRPSPPPPRWRQWPPYRAACDSSRSPQRPPPSCGVEPAARAEYGRLVTAACLTGACPPGPGRGVMRSLGLEKTSSAVWSYHHPTTNVTH